MGKNLWFYGDFMKQTIDRLFENAILEKEAYCDLIINLEKKEYEKELRYLFTKARQMRERYYGNKIYTRGLIEFSNYCKNDCYYCGIRRGNTKAERYRLSPEEILACADEGYRLGFRTIVLQSGEDASYSTDQIGSLVAALKEKHPDIAVTLSLGEREREVYQYWYDCGADRYLLRHETAVKAHYERLHPAELSFEHRIQCLYDLKEIGYQTGAGFMVGSPFQKTEDLAEDILFLKKLSPHMAGIGPFIAQKDSPFAEYPNGTLTQTLILLALVRLTLKNVLLPATTALGTIAPDGREKGILAGANVVMPNLSPVSVRKKYQLYDNKICTGEESAQCRKCLENRVRLAGCELVTDRGDYAETMIAS